MDRDNREGIRSASGRRLEELTLEAVRAGLLSVADFRISRETLLAQAEAAEAAGFDRVAENLRRAAELTRLSNEELLEIYTALRPGRASYARLLELAHHLAEELEAPRTAALVREAAEEYRRRGLVE